MSKAAKLNRYYFYILATSILLVGGIAILRPVRAGQQADPRSVQPDVQVPADEVASPSEANSPLPTAEQSAANSIASSADAKGEAASPAGTAADQMVLDELLKVIQDPKSNLNVPPLSYPASVSSKMAASQNASVSEDGLNQLELRWKSIRSLTESTQALIREIKALQAAGDSQDADVLKAHLQTLQAMISQMAAP